jgi:hypothetical protein
VRSLFAGRRDVGFNGGFEQAMTAEDGTERPAMWTAIGLNGLAATRTTDAARRGRASVRLASERPAYGQLEVAPVETGARVGRCAEAAAWATGRVAAGHVRLVVTWFDERSRPVARRWSRLPANEGRWSRARLRACPPSGAAFSRVVVEAVALDGEVWVDDVTFAWR